MTIKIYTNNIKQINYTPSVKDNCGSYKVIDPAGKYWGHYYVGLAWTGEKFVASADPRDGRPWS